MGPRAGEPGLDRSAGGPLHAQVAAALRAEIRGRQLPAGTPLPSEAALCRRFGVARSVVRQALATLAGDGLIRREPGRAAAVAPPFEHRRLVQRTTGLFDQFAGTGVALRTRVLRLEAASAPPAVAEFFGAVPTLAIERLRYTDGGPLAYVRTWLPAAAVPGLCAADLEDVSLHGVLAARYGRRPGSGRNRIRAVAADAGLAGLLDVPAGSPLLQLEGQAADGEGHPLEWFQTWHRADRLVFDVDVSPAGEALEPALAGGAAAAAAPGSLSGAAGSASSAPAASAGPSRDAPSRLARLEALAAELQAEIVRLRR